MKKIITIKSTSIHVIIWITYALITFNWVSSAWSDYEQSLWLTLRIISLHAFVFYINVYLLLPKLMEQNKYFLYLFSITLLLIGVYFLRDILNDLIPLSRPERNPGIPERVRQFPENVERARRYRAFMGINPRLIMDMVSSVAILFIGTTFWVTKQNRKRQQAEISLKNENLGTELKLLKSQINPHFLFNALNNIYSLSMTNQSKAPDMILKLSDMLRYVLYESNETKVSLEKEIAYIKHYIDFQKLKMEGETNITMQLSVENPMLTVEPMLFIPFIENSFKHSNVESNKGWININLTTHHNEIIFTIENSKPQKEYSKDGLIGIGVENVKKRLQLLYPGKHDLKITVLPESFAVKLTIGV